MKHSSVAFPVNGGREYLGYFRPLFNDFLFFITARTYFHCLTYFPIIKDLAIILNDDLHVHV